MTIKEMVGKILKSFPESRNNDKLLWRSVCAHYFDLGMSVSKMEFCFGGLPDFKTVVRERRRFNRQGLYLPTKQEITKKRRQLEKKFRDKYHPFNYNQ